MWINRRTVRDAHLKIAKLNRYRQGQMRGMKKKKAFYWDDILRGFGTGKSRWMETQNPILQFAIEYMNRIETSMFVVNDWGTFEY